MRVFQQTAVSYVLIVSKRFYEEGVRRPKQERTLRFNTHFPSRD